jgi:hypothetical protein
MIGLVDLVAGDADRAEVTMPDERDHGDLGRAGRRCLRSSSRSARPTGKPAPIAAAIGSSIRKGVARPAFLRGVEHRARSTSVTPDGDADHDLRMRPSAARG